MSTERVVTVLRGAVMVPVTAVLGIGGVVVLVSGGESPSAIAVALGIVALGLAVLTLPGYFTLQPNEARVLVLFGNYKGTVRSGGFHWANPFFSNAAIATGTTSESAPSTRIGRKESKPGARFKISLRARTLLGDRLKVNDHRGNPVEIAAMVVWRVEDTAQAAFDVDNYENYVRTQAETALRHIATAYDYDQGDGNSTDEITLRGNPDEVSAALRADLGRRLAPAGVVVDDARLTHLAYAPEIAQAMLRRQQAEAVIAARRKIVTGAVSMVEMALTELDEHSVVTLDEERRAAMVSNLLVVLCGESDVTPVVNTGTLYQ